MKFTISEIMSFVGVWLGGMFTQSLTADGGEIIKCREDLLDLERALEHLYKSLKNPHRREEQDIESIYFIKNILRKLAMHHAGLVVKNGELKKLISQSLNRIREGEVNYSDWSNRSNIIGVDLVGLWGENIDGDYKLTKIEEFKDFFYAGLLKRLVIKFKIYHTILLLLSLISSWFKSS